MKPNITTILLLAIAAFVGWKFVMPLLAAQAPPTALPAGGKTNTNQPDLVGSIVGAVDSIFKFAGAVAQTSQKTT